MSDNSGNILLGVLIVGGLGYALFSDDKTKSYDVGDAMAADAANLAVAPPDTVQIPIEQYYGDTAELPATDLLSDSNDDALANALAALKEAEGLDSSLPNFSTELPSYSGSSSSYSYSYGGDEDEDRPEFDEYEAKRQAEREMSRKGYDYSYGCTVDCSGHEAGWQWRAENGYPTYGNPYGYGNSQSFGEGAQAFEEAVEGRVEQMRDDYEAGIDYPF